MFYVLLHFYAKLGPKAHFYSEKTENFSKKGAFGAKFWALRAQNFAPPTPNFRGGQTLSFANFGGAAPPTPPR